MNINDIATPTYLKASDLQGKEIQDVIRKTYGVEFEGAKKKIVVELARDGRAVVLNRTNRDTIASAYGAETDDWTGKPVVVRAETTSFQGRPTLGVRVHIPVAPQKGAESPFDQFNSPAEFGNPFNFN
ncbi:MAG: hypothetical protein IT487_01395 [Chromatiaceae bacterium]|nr:hypothetical protein [Chromatiaceae bacterium]